MSLSFPVPQHQQPSDDRPDPTDLLTDLNDAQRTAVTHDGGPLLVVAGAGSGKTRVLTRRIAWLIAHGAHPGSILAITFTNKAANEMRERAADRVGRQARLMWVSTFHSMCVRILRREAGAFGYSSSFTIYDSHDSKQLIKRVISDMELNPKRFNSRAMLAWISGMKNELIDFEDASRRVETDTDRTYAEAYRNYQQRLRSANAMDFDDLIMNTVHLFTAFDQIRETYSRRFAHILVDEYQDTNHAQYELVRLLAGAGDDEQRSDLVVVGDSDQSIYAFRGATIRNIEEFEHDFADARTIFLEQNYRSTQTILQAANAVISKDEERRPKTLWADSHEGAPVISYVGTDERDEAQFIADQIDALADDGSAQPGQIAVFYRTNAQSRVFEEVFMRVGIAYRIVGGVRFYERKEIRDALSYLRVLANPSDLVSLRRIINEPKRGIGEKAQGEIAALADRERITFWQALQRADECPGLQTRALNAVNAFVSTMTELMELAAAPERADTVLEEVLTRTGYLAGLENSQDPQDEARVDNLAEFVAVAREFVTSASTIDDQEAEHEQTGSLAEFLEHISLVADADSLPESDEGVVTLMTLHTGKGLEFPVVFLTGMEDGLFPHSRAMFDETQLAEERRLAYVGITRAGERLYLTRAMERASWGAPEHFPPSRFLSDVPAELLDARGLDDRQQSGPVHSPSLSTGSFGTGSFSTGSFSTGSIKRRAKQDVLELAPGDKVNHENFGLGTVVTVEGEADKAQAYVDFGSAGSKWLLLRLAPVSKL